MDGDGFDAWGSQPLENAPGFADFDLNSQAAPVEEFPGLGLYGAVLQGNADELLPNRVRGAVLPPFRPPRARAGDAWATPTAPYARQLNFGGSSSVAVSRGRSSSAAAGHGGGNGDVFPGGSSSGAGGRVRQRANSSGAAPSRQRTPTAPRAGGGHRTTVAPCAGSVQRTTTPSCGGGGGRVPRPRAPRAPPPQTFGSGAPFDLDEELEDDMEELASSGGPPMSHANRAQWNDANNACLLELCIEQRREGRYNGAQMSGEGYQAVIDGLVARKGLLYTVYR
jgi:hypothetical protein